MSTHDLDRDEFQLWKESRCITCGDRFEPVSVDHLFCTSTCRQRRHRERFRQHVEAWNGARAPRAATCTVCRIEFACGSRGMLPKRCPECAKTARRVA